MPTNQHDPSVLRLARQQAVGEARLKEVDDLVQEMAAEVAALKGEVGQISSALKANTDVTIEIRDIIAAVKGGFKVLGWLGTGAKWLSVIAGAIASGYLAWYQLTHGGQLPGPK